ncbi:MAG TPA: hypothetical protein VMF30_17360 [Pirellulales bacterium]|nr:hypothetical protein [Pirellulales bacterium]
MQMSPTFRARSVAYGGLLLAALAGSTGCQSLVGGQVLPSPWYQTDDVQYYAPGPEFKLSREAAALKAFKEEKTPETEEE